jgi:HEPN domain-containing protein
MPEPPEVRRFHRVALQRFGDAEILQANDRTTGAMYLAGYAVECVLKALLLAHVPAGRHGRLVESFRGKIGHSFEWLAQELRRRGVRFPAEVLRSLRRVNSWSTDLRYNAGKQKLSETRAFLDATVQVVQWVERKL